MTWVPHWLAKPKNHNGIHSSKQNKIAQRFSWSRRSGLQLGNFFFSIATMDAHRINSSILRKEKHFRVVISDTPSSFRTVRRFDGVSPLFSPREPNVCPVAGFLIQTDHVAIPAKSLRQGPTWGDLQRRDRQDETFEVSSLTLTITSIHTESVPLPRHESPAAPV